jgi:hypothetical protein
MFVLIEALLVSWVLKPDIVIVASMLVSLYYIREGLVGLCQCRSTMLLLIL